MQVKRLIELLKKVPEESIAYFGFQQERIDPDDPGYPITSVVVLLEQTEQHFKTPVVVIRGE